MLTTPLSPREEFIATLSTGPMLTADAIVVLCGEDCEPRLAVGAQLLRSGAARTILLSGGVDDGTRRIGAQKARGVIMGMGIAPDRVEVEAESQHTRDQAVNVVRIAVERGWKRLLLVASNYHQYRAYLTFVRALRETGQDEAIWIVNAPVGHTGWWQAPVGTEVLRRAFMAEEFDKIARYGDHVASYEEGLAYLKYWEGR